MTNNPYSLLLPELREVREVKDLGERIGYGNMMRIASALWRIDLKKLGAPSDGAFVPVLPQDLKDHAQQDNAAYDYRIPAGNRKAENMEKIKIPASDFRNIQRLREMVAEEEYPVRLNMEIWLNSTLTPLEAREKVRDGLGYESGIAGDLAGNFALKYITEVEEEDLPDSWHGLVLKFFGPELEYVEMTTCDVRRFIQIIQDKGLAIANQLSDRDLSDETDIPLDIFCFLFDQLWDSDADHLARIDFILSICEPE